MAVIATIEGLRDLGTASITSLFTPPFFVEKPALVYRQLSPTTRAEALAQQASREAKIAVRRARILVRGVRALDRRPPTPAVVAARRNAAVEAVAYAKRALAAGAAARAARTVGKLEAFRAKEEARTKRPAVAVRRALVRATVHAQRVQAVRAVQARHAAATSEAARMRRAEARLHTVRRALRKAKGDRLVRLRDEARRLQAEAESARATAQRFAAGVKAAVPSLPSLPADPREALAPYVEKAVGAAQAAADRLDDALDAGADVAGKLLRAAHDAAGGDASIPSPIGDAGPSRAVMLIPVAVGVAALWWLL